MAVVVHENYDDLCRLCATKTNVLIGIHIFEGEGGVREINKKITTCLPIQIHEGDHLPKMICTECVYKLDLFVNFREKTLQTQNILSELVNKLEDKPNSDKKISNPAMEMVNVPNIPEQLTMQSNELLQQDVPNMSLASESIMNSGIILNTQNIHDPLENINLTNQLQTELNDQLDLQQHTNMQLVDSELQMSHQELSVQNLELMQHDLITEQYMKPLEETRPILCLKNPTQLMDMKEVKNEPADNKSTDAKLIYSSDSDDSSDEFPNLEGGGENMFLMYDQQMPNVEASTSNGVQWYYCNVCGKTLESRDKFMSHYAEHANKCMNCDAVFSNYEALQTHRKQMHPRQLSDRETKTINNSKKVKFKNDIKEENANESIKEEESDAEFAENGDDFGDEEEEQDDETLKNTKKKRWEPKVCKECGKSYKTNYKLTEHMRKHTGEQPYKCGTCDKAFRSKIGLAQHEAKHTGHYDYSCPTCGKGFQCKSYLIVHQRVHSDLKPYPCTTCGRHFKTKQSLLDHMNRHLGVKPYLCETCGRGFITKGLCKSHQKVHSGMDNRQYPCNVCNKMFVSKSYLATHLRIHTGEKPFMCEVCGKGFLTRVDLRIHSTMHTGEKSFVCEMCGKAFARRDALRCHRRSHTGERPYRCDVCGQTFTQFSPMAIHKRLHTGERPYSCEVCSKTFVSRSTMMSHRKKHIP